MTSESESEKESHGHMEQVAVRQNFNVHIPPPKDMAPIPNTLPEDALFLISAAERRYNYLLDSELPKLRQCIGPLSVQQTLAEDIRVDTIALTRQIEVSSFQIIF